MGSCQGCAGWWYASTVFKAGFSSVLGGSSVGFGIRTFNLARECLYMAYAPADTVAAVPAHIGDLMLNAVGSVASAVVAVWLAKGLFCPTKKQLMPGFSPPKAGPGNISPRKLSYSSGIVLPPGNTQ